jgi:hypothetical protein
MNALSHGRSASWDLRRPSCRTPVRPFGSSRAPIRIHRGTGQGPGRALVTIFVDDLDRQIALSAARGLERAQHETYDNGVRKITFRDPEGAERTQLQRSSSLAAHKAAQEATTETARDAARAAAMPRPRPTCTLSQSEPGQTHPGRRSTRSTRSGIGRRRDRSVGAARLEQARQRATLCPQAEGDTLSQLIKKPGGAFAPGAGCLDAVAEYPVRGDDGNATQVTDIDLRPDSLDDRIVPRSWGVDRAQPTVLPGRDATPRDPLKD